VDTKNLFSNVTMEIATSVLTPEFKKTDYFLKIENTHDDEYFSDKSNIKYHR
jgi:hypothetical protein